MNVSLHRSLARGLGNFFQTDISYIAKGGSWIGASKVVSLITSTLVLLAFGNLVSTETYGTYQYVLSIAAILSLTTLPGMTTALRQAAAQGNEGVFYDMIKIRLQSGLCGSALSLMLSTYYYSQGQGELASAFLLTAIFGPVIAAVSLWHPTLSGRRDFKRASLYSSLFELGRAVIVVSIVLLTDDVVLILAATFLYATCLPFLFMVWVHRYHTPNEQRSESYISYGKHLTVMVVVGTIASQVDRVLLWHLLGPSVLASYTIALSPIMQAQGWFQSVEALAFPKLAAAEPERLKKTLPAKLWRLAVLVVPCVVLYILVAPWLYAAFLPQYEEAASYSQVLAIVLLFLPDKLLGAALYAKSQKNALYTVSIGVAVTRIVILGVLVPTWGIWGAVVGTITPYFVSIIVKGYFFRNL